MVCLDTDIIIDFFKKKKWAVDKISDMYNENIKISTTSINTFELFKGAFRTNQNKAIQSLKEYISNIDVYEFDIGASEKAAEIFELLRSRGELLDIADIMIAAIAIKNNESLLTKNIKHFNRIPGLILEK